MNFLEEELPDTLPQLLNDHRALICQKKSEFQKKTSESGAEYRAAVDAFLSKLAKDVWSIYIEHRRRQRLEEELCRPQMSRFARRSMPLEPSGSRVPLGKEVVFEDLLNAVRGRSFAPPPPRPTNYAGRLCAEIAPTETKEVCMLKVWLHGGSNPVDGVENVEVAVTGGNDLAEAEFRILVDAEAARAVPDNAVIKAPVDGESERKEFFVTPATDPEAVIWVYIFQGNRMVQGLQVTRPA